MTAEEFVKELRRIPIDMRSMREKSVSEDYIQELSKSYNIRWKNKKMRTDDPLVELVENYEVSKLEIGMISFRESLVSNEDYIFFGRFEIDDLVINKNLKSIQLFEHGVANILYECASNSSNFLSAILTAAFFLEKRALDDSIYLNEELTLEVAEKCGELAGSKSHFQNFYKMMLGCDF